jgi:hypothetical protein
VEIEDIGDGDADRGSGIVDKRVVHKSESPAGSTCW